MRHNARIARSGVQYYTYAELPKMGLTSVPREFKDLRIFGVYRSAQCLKEAIPMFKDVPVMRGHEKWAVGGVLEPMAVGSCEEVPKLRMHKGEAVITAPLDLDDDHILDDISELSPGYSGKYHWQGGVAPTGEEFQIVCDKITEVNHIALVPEARGGEEMKVLDGGTGMKKIRSGLLWFARRKTQKIADGDKADAFLSTLEDIRKNRKAWTPEEMEEHVTTLSALIKDLPDSEEKEKLERFILDIPLLKEEDDATAEEALNTLMEFYSSLDKDAISDIMENGSMDDPNKPVGAPNPSTNPAPAVPVPEPTPEPKNTPKPAAPTQDEPPADPVLALLTKMCDKLDAVLDAVAKPASSDKKSDETNDLQTKDENPKSEESKSPENKIGDQMPIFTQTMNTVNQGNNLDDVFAKMKERR